MCQDGIGLNVATQEWCDIESCSPVGWTGIKQVMYKMERQKIKKQLRVMHQSMDNIS